MDIYDPAAERNLRNSRRILGQVKVCSWDKGEKQVIPYDEVLWKGSNPSLSTYFGILMIRTAPVSARDSAPELFQESLITFCANAKFLHYKGQYNV